MRLLAFLAALAVTVAAWGVGMWELHYPDWAIGVPLVVVSGAVAIVLYRLWDGVVDSQPSLRTS
jgi:hypothetical protein